MEPVGQCKFEFRQWKEVFKLWREWQRVWGDEMQLVISTNSYTSGYWIEEKGKGLTPGDHVYTGEQVFELEKRIIEEIELAKREQRSPRLVL